ncbi:MAG: glycoside hydrolase domain-containing protein [Terriglobales bacterium]
MRLWLSILVCTTLSFSPLATAADSHSSYLGFDRNEYPGDDNLKELRKTFAFAGYWLNDPPGSKTNTWIGKRSKVEAAGFGFLVLFNGRLYRDLKANAPALGKSDGDAAIAAVRREGFPSQTIIFLDQEQGGRLLPEQKAYLFSWIDEVNKAGFRAAVYCSGIAAPEAGAANVVTAEDIKTNAGTRNITYWVTNDACPPSPGCVASARPPLPSGSKVDFAEVWQFAQSPKRKDVATACGGYDKTGSCFPSAAAAMQSLHVDLDTASSADPSHGRTR